MGKKMPQRDPAAHDNANAETPGEDSRPDGDRSEPGAIGQSSELESEVPAASSLTPTPTMGDAAGIDPLMQEVQSFLDQRETLARKLATEIAATEKKLAELKRTAAELFPDSVRDSGKDKKARKLTRSTSKAARSEPANPDAS